MKKVYQEPLFRVERFSLSQSIAYNCGWNGQMGTIGKPGHGSKATCGWEVYGVTYWTAGSVCNQPMDSNGSIDGFCYNTPEGGMTVFASA